MAPSSRCSFRCPRGPSNSGAEPPPRSCSSALRFAVSHGGKGSGAWSQQCSCSWGWAGVGAGSCAAGIEAPTLQGQADVTKAKQTPCHNGVTANSAQHTEPSPAMAASGRGGGAGSPKGNLHTAFIRPLSSFKHMLL